MKTSPLLLVSLGAMLALQAVHGQITSAGALTRRIAPQTTPQPPPRSGAAPAGPVVTTPVDPAKVQAAKEQTDKKKLEFQKKRAEEGTDFAQYELGMRYLTGDGVEKSLELAKKWITAASTNAYKPAIKQLEKIKELEKEELEKATETKAAK